MSPQQKQQSLKSFRVALCGITLASLSACASTPDKRARDKQMALEIQREKQVSELKQSTVFQDRISQFQSKDCSVLTALIAAPEPPPEFRLLVQLKAAELCDAVPLPEVVPSWANTWFEEVGRDRARRMKLDAEFMDRSLQLAKLWPGRAQRLAALDEARDLALKLGDKARLEAIEVALEKISPARLRRPTLSDAIRQGDDYRLLGQFAQARRAYRRALDSTQTSLADRFKALEGLRWLARLENRTDEVIRVRKEMSRLSETHELKPGLLGDAERERALRQRWLNRQIDTARAYWTDQQAQAARRVLLAAEARLKGRANLLDSMFLRAAIADEARDLREMERVIAEMQLDSISNADQESRAFLAKVAWLHGWALRREAERDHDQRDQLWRRAEDALKRAYDLEPSAFLKRRNLYWLAITARDRVASSTPIGDLQTPERIESWLRELASEDSLGYYGLLASRALGQALASLAPQSRHREQMLAHGAGEGLLPWEITESFYWIYAAGHARESKLFLREVAPRGFDLEVALLLARAGDFIDLFSRSHQLSAIERDALLRKSPYLLYPSPWLEIYQRESARHELSVEWPLAISRQESSFNPLARSPADAQGLMQLIPSMAQAAARRLRLPALAPGDLEKPEVNISLGTAHLAELRERLGHLTLATMAYNASERAVINWTKTRLRQDFIAFIEEVPYEETRTYAKLVIRNVALYRRLLHSEDLYFPEEWVADLRNVSH
jgi:soluble lytic murein transglycosylase